MVRIQMTVEKLIARYLLRPIRTGANSEMNQSESQATTSNLHKARKKIANHHECVIGFASHWLKHWREIF